ncbi:NADPH:adrenodoxin oxidoreductase, mitochondrial isoform X4 [Cephus cinctus]|uniref:NADPH:adrenodoxin oxidoreductase, mitochondrial n=1 Tax=Cephus cinctus TaxID=211228 RepID=A0AAJ7C174_CEPCN|nr:NADPH:adrenodoxin oxidoreductase, mitochondrial isoform X4 [Cephus cinctus]
MKYNLTGCHHYLKGVMKCRNVHDTIRHFCNKSSGPSVCIVGGGPAGFYAAQQVLKTLPDTRVDILERLPVPFGLVRFGVAPDHPEVKNVINTFNKTAQNPRFQFLGNVNVGSDVTVEQLKENYHAVILTYGAEEDRVLGIPGENLNNVISGRRFVGWYNGVPADKNLQVNLDVEEAIVLGQGNVAMDIARILLTPIDKLKSTDITEYALEQLSRSKIKKVSLVGRRGPLQAAFTIAELRELIKLENCKTHWRPDDFSNVREIVEQLKRPKKRLMELMLKSLDESIQDKRSCSKNLHPIFLRSPIEMKGSDSVEEIKFSVNVLEGEISSAQIAKATGQFEEIPCGIALRSIGYRSVPIDNKVPFDMRKGHVLNTSGKVERYLYAAGWVATGPVGVILSTMTNAFQVGSMVCKEINRDIIKPGYEGLSEILKKKNITTVFYQDWEKINKVEEERGRKLGKPREKIVDINEMLEIASK